MMARKKCYVTYVVKDMNGNVLAVRKTPKGIVNWREKHRVERVGGSYLMRGKTIFIDMETEVR